MRKCSQLPTVRGALPSFFQEWDRKLRKATKLNSCNINNMIQLLNFSLRCDAVNEKGLIT